MILPHKVKRASLPGAGAAELRMDQTFLSGMAPIRPSGRMPFGEGRTSAGTGRSCLTAGLTSLTPGMARPAPFTWTANWPIGRSPIPPSIPGTWTTPPPPIHCRFEWLARTRRLALSAGLVWGRLRSGKFACRTPLWMRQPSRPGSIRRRPSFGPIQMVMGCRTGGRINTFPR